MAERMVKEFKLRMAIKLDTLKKKDKINWKLWKEYIPFVVDSINNQRSSFRSRFAMLVAYFTQKPQISLPQHQDRHFLYKIGDKVRFFRAKSDRKALNSKWSLTYGKIPKPECKIFSLFFCKSVHSSYFRFFVPPNRHSNKKTIISIPHWYFNTLLFYTSGRGKGIFKKK